MRDPVNFFLGRWRAFHHCRAAHIGPNDISVCFNSSPVTINWHGTVQSAAMMEWRWLNSFRIEREESLWRQRRNKKGAPSAACWPSPFTLDGAPPPFIFCLFLLPASQFRHLVATTWPNPFFLLFTMMQITSPERKEREKSSSTIWVELQLASRPLLAGNSQQTGKNFG